MNSLYWELIQPNIDQFGVVAQKNGDGGDSFEREGMLMCAIQYLHNDLKISDNEYNLFKERYVDIVELLTVGQGFSFRRHPDKSKWYGQADRMSRDQLVPNIIALGHVKDSLRSPLLSKILMFSLVRLGFATNIRDNFIMPNHANKYRMKLPDFLGPSVLAAFIRAMGLKILYPLVCLLDAELVVNSLLILRRVAKDPTQSDQNTHLALILQSIVTMPTPLSILAKKIYQSEGLSAPPSYTNGQMLSHFGPQTALDHYYDKNQSGGAPALNQVYREVLAHMFRTKEEK